MFPAGISPCRASSCSGPADGASRALVVGAVAATLAYHAGGLTTCTWDDSELMLPPMDTTMRYSARIKTEAVVKLGVYSLETLIRKLLKKNDSNNVQQKIKALEDGVKRMKRETERSLLMHLKDYKENVKFQYMYKLTDAMSEHLYKGLLESFNAYFTDISNMVDLIREERIDKSAALEELEWVEKNASLALEKIDGLREKIRLAAEPKKSD